MIEDFGRVVPHGAELDFDICIAGGGAAGITLAMALADSGKKICLLEGGGLTPPTPAEADLYRGELGDRIYPLPASRLRFFGGSTNHWGGWCRPLDAIDFEERSFVPLSGWPITRTELDPYYARAHEVCEIPSDTYDPELVTTQDNQLPDLDGFCSKVFRFSPPTRFGARYREAIASAGSVTAFMGANVIGLSREGSRITQVHVRSLNGDTQATVRAGRFVLAMGGIENARLLLMPGHGTEERMVPNDDFVGRCFMDHFGFTPGYLLAASGLNYLRFQSSSGGALTMLSLTQEELRKREYRGFGIMLQPFAPDPSYDSEVLSNPGFTNPQTTDAVRYRMVFMNEPTPNRDSRVTLLEDVDAIGMPRVHLDWRINSEDFENVDRVMRDLARSLGRAGLARLQITRDARSAKAVGSANMHHMGTTRMSASAELGVVDANCKVHGLENLFVAGSSVFPTPGFCNPTLTIVALAERLADHLRSEQAA